MGTVEQLNAEKEKVQKELRQLENRQKALLNSSVTPSAEPEPAAYRSGTKLTNEWDGLTHDYTHKGSVIPAD
ncbi:hypothetical protein [Blautia luti]|uniref:Uncharacterized protein n=1 Tax=Blautia luti TaxID=89014 RepID=A0A564VI58_9FIRM|nr:hypothetical protein [Blautia luti]VUX31713.1 Uncharacterised protein [Blautia luti]